ncbi:MAG: hypothetical protein WCX65_02730 [bacterium]
MIGAALFNRLDSIPYSPLITPKAFCENQPCVNIHSGSLDFILNQPTSTAIVYILGAMWIAAGLYFLRSRGGQRSRSWWGVALLLGGAAALSAGTSYQAFGYEIKCAGREFCAWTSWWEVAYLTLQAASMDAMLIALAYACAAGKLRKALICYAVANAAAHFAVTAIGALTPVKFMISFELMILFSTPNLALFFILSGWRYSKYRQAMDLSLLGAGVWLVVTTGAYFAYMTLGITQKLWKQGIWFSDNDTLHIFMIIWIIYITIALGRHLKDTASPQKL